MEIYVLCTDCLHDIKFHSPTSFVPFGIAKTQKVKLGKIIEKSFLVNEEQNGNSFAIVGDLVMVQDYSNKQTTSINS